MLKYNAILIGATGATGKEVLKQLIAKKNCQKVTAITRRDISVEIKSDKLVQIQISNFKNLNSTSEYWKNHQVFFNCIGTTKKISKTATRFKDVEVSISENAAILAEKNKIIHSTLISSKGANKNQWYKTWIHPLYYLKIMGLKEETIVSKSFRSKTIFRPGMLIRYNNSHQSLLKNIIKMTQFGLPVKDLASAMINDAEENIKKTNRNECNYYIGNRSIKRYLKIYYSNQKFQKNILMQE